MPFSRKEQLINLEKEAVYDLLIIGGGIVGSATLAMASADGLNSILLEKNDFASGASSRSTKLLHGGIRYLLPKTSASWKRPYHHGGIH